MHSTRSLLLSLVLFTPAGAGPKAAPPAAPPRGKVRLRQAKPAPAGRILTLKPGQKRLTPEQLRLLTRKPGAKKRPVR